MNIFLRLFKFFAGWNAVEQVTIDPYCRNWIGVDREILPKLYDWMDANIHLRGKQICPIECPDYQYKTEKYFNASLIFPYPVVQQDFADICTMPCLQNTDCNKRR